MKRILLLLLPSVAMAAPPKVPPVEMGPGSKAVTPEILDAVSDEMTRSMGQLQIPGTNAPKPYHISYKITEVEVHDVSAELGHVTTWRPRHNVFIEARVRVGSRALDNGNFAVPQNENEFDGVASLPLPLEATPRIARRAAWLVTDAAYKEALIQLRAKLESRAAGGSHGSPEVPAWTDEKPSIGRDPVLVPPLESREELETRAKLVSAVLRDQVPVRESHVAATSYLERRWYINTEGTNVTDTRRASGIVITANGRATDGQEVRQYLLRYGKTAKDLPSDDELKAEAKKLAEQVAQMEKAPLMDRYSGPVLFEGEGAVGFVRFTLAPNLGGTPVPEGISPQEQKQWGGALTDKVGLRVTSPNLTIVDDPTAATGAGKALVGGYRIDDEGVAAQRVEVVKDGTLKTLLTSRTPSQKDQKSNGHARRTAEGGAFHGSATNLMISGKGAVPRRALEQQALAAARADGLKYVLVIRRFDDAAVSAVPEFTKRELVQMIKTTDQQLPPPTVLAYKLYPNGKEELVRGVQLGEVPIRAWKDVLGISKELTAYNFLVADASQLELRLRAGTDDTFVPSGGIESSIVTPDLLLKEIDVTGVASERPAPAVSRPGK